MPQFCSDTSKTIQSLLVRFASKEISKLEELVAYTLAAYLSCFVIRAVETLQWINTSILRRMCMIPSARFVPFAITDCYLCRSNQSLSKAAPKIHRPRRDVVGWPVINLIQAMPTEFRIDEQFSQSIVSHPVVTSAA